MKKYLLKIAMVAGLMLSATTGANAFIDMQEITDGISNALKTTSDKLSISEPKQDYGTLAQTYADWKVRIPTMLNTPEGAVKMYFDGVYSYMNPKTRNEGQKMLRYILREDADWDTKPSMNTFVSRMKDPNQHYIFKSFAKGSTPENGYLMDINNYELMFVNKAKETDYTRVMIKSSGSDTDKGVWVKQFSDGNWHVINNANLYGNVRKPTNTQDNSFDADFD